MKTILLTMIFLTCISAVNAQNELTLTGKAIKDISPVDGVKIKKGDLLTLIGYNIVTTSLNPQMKPDYVVQYLSTSDEKNALLSQSDIDKIDFNPPTSTKDAWDYISVKNEVLPYLIKNGMQFDMRSEMDEECHLYLQQLEEGNYLLNDDYIEGYLQSLATNIHSATLPYGRPGNIAVKILKTSDINAFCMPNGTVLLTTELLSTINSEEELIGVLAHEIAHFALDHQVKNLTAQIQRQKRAEFWAGLATAFAAVGEVYLATNNDVYMGGNLIMATAILATSIADEVIDRMGAKYSIDQEKVADEAAGVILTAYGKNKSAYGSVLIRVRDYYFKQGKYAALFSSNTHPDITSRIKACGGGDPEANYSDEFLQKISAVNTFSAIKEYNLLHYVKCNELLDKNIKAQVATETDYIMKAMVLRSLYDTPDRMNEALSYLSKAESLNVYSYNSVFKEKGLILLRLKRNEEAKKAFNTYLVNLEKSEVQKTQYITNEIKWSREMIYKSSKL